MAEERKFKNYEESDVQLRGLVWSGIGLSALMVVAFLVIIGIFNFLETWNGEPTKPVSPLAESQEPPAGPRLQIDPELDMAQFKAIEDSLVNSYGWVQKEARVVRIPVKEAMKIMLEKGFPVREEGAKN